MKKMQKKEKSARSEAVKELQEKELEGATAKVIGCFGTGVCFSCAEC